MLSVGLFFVVVLGCGHFFAKVCVNLYLGVSKIICNLELGAAIGYRRVGGCGSGHNELQVEGIVCCKGGNRGGGGVVVIGGELCHW